MEKNTLWKPPPALPGPPSATQQHLQLPFAELAAQSPSRSVLSDEVDTVAVQGLSGSDLFFGLPLHLKTLNDR